MTGLPGSEGGGLEQSEDVEREQPEAGADGQDTTLRDTLRRVYLGVKAGDLSRGMM